MKHTFVICAYKESLFLENCIISLLSQESVKNGDSHIQVFTATPNAFITALCEKYRLPLHVGVSQGIGANWNEALSTVTTPFATIAHQDDLYAPDYGSAILAAFEEREKSLAPRSIAFTDYREIDEQGSARKRTVNLRIKSAALKVLSLFRDTRYQRRVMAFGDFISCPTVSYNLTFLRAHGFVFSESLKMALDWDAWERIMKLPGDISFIPRRLMAHRIYGDSTTSLSIAQGIKIAEERSIFERYWGQSPAGRLMTRILVRFYHLSEASNNG